MIFSYKNSVQIKDDQLLSTAQSLNSYIQKLQKVASESNYNEFESSINLPFDEDLVTHVTKVKEKMVNEDLKYIIDIGIGGSNLGTKAIYDALYGYFDLIQPDVFPKMIVEDTTDSEMLKKLGDFLSRIKNPKEILINVVSKSGRTTEAIANMEIILSRNPKLKERLVITTDFESDLWNVANDMNIPTLPVPKKVGGRYSVLSAVGLFPLLCAEVNIFLLLEGAMEMRDICLKNDITKNPALASAVAIYLNYKNGKTIHDSFVFHPELESLGKWYRQLMGESLGKRGVGITPTVSVGSTDLHSVGQLYLGGPEDKFFTFISSKGHKDSVMVPENPLIPSTIAEIKGKTANQIMYAIFESVKDSYSKKGLPFFEIELADISEKSLGKYLQFKMIEMMFLGKLMDVNAFDQPNVESYKKETINILKFMK